MMTIFLRLMTFLVLMTAALLELKAALKVSPRAALWASATPSSPIFLCLNRLRASWKCAHL